MVENSNGTLHLVKDNCREVLAAQGRGGCKGVDEQGAASRGLSIGYVGRAGQVVIVRQKSGQGAPAMGMYVCA